MTVLGHIANRLKTDIGENVRAIHDVTYSRQLTESRFNEKARDKLFQREQEIRDEIRTQELFDAQNSQRAALHLSLFENTFDEMRSTGNRGPMVRLVDSPGFDPLIREHAARTLNARLGQSIEGIKAEADIQRLAQVIETEDARLLMERERIDNQKEQFLVQELRIKAKADYDKAIDMANKRQSFINRDAWLDHIKSTKGIFTPEEIQEAETIMANGDNETAKAGWVNLWNRANARILAQNQADRARITAKATAAANLPPASAITNNEFREASLLLGTTLDEKVANDDELKDFLEEMSFDFPFFGKDNDIIRSNRDVVMMLSARIAKTANRDPDTGASEPDLESALDLILRTGRGEGGKINTITPVRLVDEIKQLQLQNPEINLQTYVRWLNKNPEADPVDVLNSLKEAKGVK